MIGRMQLNYEISMHRGKFLTQTEKYCENFPSVSQLLPLHAIQPLFYAMLYSIMHASRDVCTLFAIKRVERGMVVGGG